MGRAGERTNAAQGEPASEGDACHAEADEDCEQEEDFEGDEREAGCGGAGRGGGTGAMLAPGNEGQQRGGEGEENEERAEDVGEGNLCGGAKPAGVTRFELRAPEDYVEVIGDGGEVAIDGRPGERL